MNPELTKRFIQFSQNPASWVGEHCRQELIQANVPAKVLDKFWRQPYLSPVIENYLKLVESHKLVIDELEQPAAKVLLLPDNKFIELLIYCGICTCCNSLHKLISKVHINQAEKEFGAGPLQFARSGRAAECMQSATNIASLPIYVFPGIQQYSVLCSGYGIWLAAAKNLNTAWISRSLLQVPTGANKTTECEVCAGLPVEIASGILRQILRNYIEEFPWLE